MGQHRSYGETVKYVCFAPINGSPWRACLLLGVKRKWLARASALLLMQDALYHMCFIDDSVSLMGTDK